SFIRSLHIKCLNTANYAIDLYKSIKFEKLTMHWIFHEDMAILPIIMASRDCSNLFFGLLWNVEKTSVSNIRQALMQLPS
ncbi:hypothetical protein PFISCL1PPCAC_25754, partial [Pristionchus fissidentatus]